ncbi:hypothetical protein CFAM422_012272 [Trichoderma lentiforme]|uniref:NWD NACHT-NTPase N-terminal domain-containing protein n=1 Tax=Trichoderma lentiforme TaxID=1567552 RepID=A0A9P4X512_9HYPO|nr:hypothetical protein CFAM422_012272 [Trichoderma lentiforme]
MASKVNSKPIGFLRFTRHMPKLRKDQTFESTGLESETSDHSDKCKPSLWDRAYDGLKETDGQLVEEYEKLLSTQLQTNTGQKPSKPINLHDNTQKDTINAKNQIHGTDRNKRLEQLKTITDHGLEQLEDGRTKYRIFGHNFTLHNQLAQATRFIQNIRNVIDEAVRVSPYASLAWAGFSVILPIFMNPSIAEEASRNGCLYVTSRMQFYVKLESLLLSSDRLQASGLSAELEDRLIELYRQIIDFQIKVVRRVYLTRLARVKEDIIRHEDWEVMVAKIRESEKILSNDAKQVNDASMGRELEKLSGNAEKFFEDITSALVSPLTDRHRELIFRNDGSGIQYNTTGGKQNITTGNGKNFSEVTFTGTVMFN